MKRMVFLASISFVLVATGFGVFLRLDRPHTGGDSADRESVPQLNLRQVVEERFPANESIPWEQIRDVALDEHYREFGGSLTDSVVPNVRQQVRDRRASYLRPFAAEYLPDPDSEIAECVRVWLKHHSERGEYNNQSRASELETALQSIPSQPSEQPLLTLIRIERARLAADKPAALNHLRGLRTKQWGDQISVFCRLNPAYQYRLLLDDGAQISEAEQELISLTVEFLAEQCGSQHDHDDAQFIWEIVHDTHAALTIHGKILLTQASLQTEGIHDWFAHLLIGETSRDVAWDRRGGGYADTVSDVGWQSFEEYMAIASTHDRLAWALRPDIPFASERMIMVSRAHGDEWTPRMWFDLTVQAQFDYFDAYTAYLHTLKPRWGGSVREMLDFGYECAATADFPSQVANFLYCVIDQAAEEVADQRIDADVRDSYVGELLRNAELQQELRTQWAEFDRQLDDGLSLSAGRIADAYSWRAACALQMKDADTVTACLPKIHDANTWAGFADLYFDQSAARARALAFAYGTEHRDAVEQLESHFGKFFDGETSVEELQAAAERLTEIADDLEEPGRRWANALQIKLAHLLEFYSEKTVHLRFDDLSGWQCFGQIEVEDDDTLVVTNWPNIYAPRIRTRTPFPPPYEVVATLETVAGKTPLSEIGVDLGAS